MIDAFNRKDDVLGGKEELTITISKSLKMTNVRRPKFSLFPFYQIMPFLSRIHQMSNKITAPLSQKNFTYICFSSALQIVQSCNLGSENMENMEKMDDIYNMSKKKLCLWFKTPY